MTYNQSIIYEWENVKLPVINSGDHVQVVTRDQTPSDIKSGLYYAHFAGLRGTILKLYGEEASVLITRDSMPGEVKSRHIEGEKAMRQRWLDGMSEEGRGRLSQKEKDFTLNYAILVALKDLVPAAEGADAAPVEPPVPPAVAAGNRRNALATAAAVEAIDLATGDSTVGNAARISAADLDAKEAEFLKKLTNAGSGKS